jgi:hypothetical protein
LGPKTYYFSQRAELNTSGTGIIGSGYASCIKGESAGTYIILLIQHGTFGALNGIVLRDFRIDGNDGGQLDAGLLACNNVVGGVIDNVWVENGTRVSGSSGVNGMSFSAGNTTKAGINWTSESVEAYFAGNKVWEIGGNGTAPGFQVNGGFNGKIIGNDVEDCEGPGIYLATDGSGRPPRNATVALNTVRNCGNASTTLGDGIHVTNSSGTNVGRIIIAGNQIYDCGNATGGGSAIFVQNDDNLVIEGNIGRNCYYDGVRIASCNHVTVTGGRYSGNNVAGVSYAGGIHVLGTCGHVTITGVTCSDDKSVKTQSYGLILESGAVLSNLTVESCDFAGNAVGEVLMLAGFKRGRMALSLYRDTSDGIAVPVLAMAMPDECAYVVTQRSIGTKSDGSDRAIYSRQGLFYRDAGGNATRQGATTTLGTDIESNGSWGGAAMGVSTTYAVAQVQGVGSTTVHWSTRLEIESIAA